MSRIQEAFQKEKAFIPFITCGDPDLKTTEQLVYAMEQAGASIIELGIPFSDPTAEGPVIQAANIRALSGGVTTDRIFEMVERIRKKSRIPLVFMTYANVVFSYGTERFTRRAAQAGLDGLILPDVPFEEKEEFDVPCKKAGLDLISLIAPTSHDRIRMIAREASGFVYCVSSLGVTGTRETISTDVIEMIRLVKETDEPLLRRSNRRKRHCKTLRSAQKRMRAICGGIYRKNGRGSQKVKISSMKTIRKFTQLAKKGTDPFAKGSVPFSRSCVNFLLLSRIL